MHSNTDPAGAQPPGRLWLLTGASSGIGRAIAVQLAAAGDRVIAWGRDAERLRALQAEQPAAIVATLSLDLGATAMLARAAADCAAQWPELSGLIHCAGLQHARLLEDPALDAAAIGQELAVNLAAPIELSRALLPQLRSRPSAVIVFVGSVLARAPKRRAAGYNASKAGLQAFAASLRAQLRGGTVQVLELIPPLVETPMTAGRRARKISPERVARALLQQLARPRLPAQLWVGPARWVRLLLRLAPATTRRLFLR